MPPPPPVTQSNSDASNSGELPTLIIASTPGTKFQVRALAPRGQLSQAEFESIALFIAEAYNRSTACVTFFDSEERLIQWPLLQDADRPHWLCDVSVETNERDQLYASSFHLAVDEATSQPRMDVLVEAGDVHSDESENDEAASPD